MEPLHFDQFAILSHYSRSVLPIRKENTVDYSWSKPSRVRTSWIEYLRDERDRS